MFFSVVYVDEFVSQATPGYALSVVRMDSWLEVKEYCAVFPSHWLPSRMFYLLFIKVALNTLDKKYLNSLSGK